MRVIVCGTGFGRIYMRALEQPPFELAGILARGSDRSHACARQYGVPLFTSPDEVPGDVDLVCVVVPSGVGGGRGAELAQAFLARGIPVLLEHPVHAGELAECLRTAARHRVMFGVNTFYVNLEPVRRFLTAARRLLSAAPPVFVHASCAVQVSYDLLDIVGQALGGVSPWALGPVPEVPDRLAGLARPPFVDRCVDAVIAGVPVTLRVHNQFVPDDPDHPTHLRHEMTLGTEAGSLTLAGTHGPVLWSPAIHVPRDDGTFSLVDVDDTPTVVTLGPADAPSARDVFDVVWPEGVRHSLSAMRQQIADGADPLTAGQYHLALSRLWSELTRGLGYPEPVSRERAPRIGIGDLT
ncbi:Gfo/Idh/MocA family oxidoreductase [Rhodococcus maanshanensis]|uniref:Gfo/Idh/MocA family oxidoreductase n=1 Tax=Rhodococcus maanshanensis TaxID=183556 RepID=UPI0022B3BAD5|nr:Gfo/Idh/MocA family oxidoreductase [Rhodococcus maanshanensis]MCZ4556788.1 Gfo/Idh/MocA family oxidoreductase [Rhodococcus maanshanensis]